MTIPQLEEEWIRIFSVLAAGSVPHKTAAELVAHAAVIEDYIEGLNTQVQFDGDMDLDNGAN